MKLADFKIDSSKTIAELSGKEILQPSFHSSLTENVTKYSNMPLKKVGAEGLRLLLVQNFCLDFVVPATICCLNEQPNAGGDMEEGALMRTLFTLVEKSFWDKNPGMLSKSAEVLRASRKLLNAKLSNETDPEEKSLLLEADENYRRAEQALAALHSIKNIRR